MVVEDNVANTKSNLSFVKSIKKRCAREGIKEGDRISLFKIRKVKVQAEEEGRSIIIIEVMIQIRFQLSATHHAIYRTLNQEDAIKLRKGVYVFDVNESKYHDRTFCSLTL